MTFIRDENTVGDYDVRLKLSRGGQDYYSETRRVMVAEVAIDWDLELIASEDYICARPGAYTQPAQPLTATAKLKFVGAPQPGNIKSGLIQGVKVNQWTESQVAKNFRITWKDEPPLSQTIMYASRIYCDEMSGWLCDNEKRGEYLYYEPPLSIDGEPLFLDDIAMAKGEPITRSFAGADGTLKVTYEDEEATGSIDYSVWVVVVIENAEPHKSHYIPLRVQDWQLRLDTNNHNPEDVVGKCLPQGQPRNPDGPPADGSKTSSREDFLDKFDWVFGTLVPWIFP